MFKYDVYLRDGRKVTLFATYFEVRATLPSDPLAMYFYDKEDCIVGYFNLTDVVGICGFKDD